MAAPEEAKAEVAKGQVANPKPKDETLSIGRLFKNASFYSIGQVLSAVLGFVTDPILSHILTRADYGLLGLTRTTGNLLTNVYRLGLDGAANRVYYDVEGDEAAQRRTLGTINSFLLIWVIALSIAQELFGPAIYARAFAGLPYAPYGRFVAYGLACSSLTALAQMVWSAQEKARFLAGLRVITMLLTTGISFGLLLGTKMGVMSLYISSAVGPSLMLWVHLRFAWGKFGFAWDKKALRNALVFGLPLVVHTSSHWALDAADRYLLERYLGREMVGVYSVAYGSATTLILFNGSINSAYVPQFIRAQQQPDGVQFVAKSITYFWLTALTACLGFVVFGPFIIRTLYAAQFVDAARYSPILGFVGPLHAAYLVYVNVLFFEQKTRLIPIITLISGVINVGLNMALIPRMGLAGATIATVAGYLVLAGAFRLGVGATKRIQLEHGRLLRVLVIFGTIAITALVLDGRYSLVLDAAIKIALALVAPLLLWASKFMTAEEETKVRNRWSNLLRKLRREPS